MTKKKSLREEDTPQNNKHFVEGPKRTFPHPRFVFLFNPQDTQQLKNIMQTE